MSRVSSLHTIFWVETQLLIVLQGKKIPSGLLVWLDLQLVSHWLSLSLIDCCSFLFLDVFQKFNQMMDSRVIQLVQRHLPLVSKSLKCGGEKSHNWSQQSNRSRLKLRFVGLNLVENIMKKLNLHKEQNLCRLTWATRTSWRLRTRGVVLDHYNKHKELLRHSFLTTRTKGLFTPCTSLWMGNGLKSHVVMQCDASSALVHEGGI